MATPGIILVFIRPKHPLLTPTVLSEWYDVHAVEDVFPHSPVDTGFKYSPLASPPAHADEANAWQLMTIFPIPDIAWRNSEEFAQINGKSDMLPEKDKTIWEQADIEFRWYERMGQFDGGKEKGMNGHVPSPSTKVEPSENVFVVTTSSSGSQLPASVRSSESFVRSTYYKVAASNGENTPDYLKVYEFSEGARLEEEALKDMEIGTAKVGAWKLDRLWGEQGARL
ncbi:MAG: hypothetical protein M1833_006169 [Piccolia ochrophora]|nr:MAG: hypothetical protein M1833_006169 [Piccolia ochrophora]